MSNRLAAETSLYLRQHSENPVDWYPWGPEALRRARAEGKPLFLSAGYSACHWCHVMARESFENVETARLLNAQFVSVKLDREERPDLDALYMRAVQIMTGQGGWPLSVFLTPSLEPFFGGTYFPPEPRFGMPSFRQVLAEVGRAFREDPRGVARSARKVRDAVQASFAPDPGPPAGAAEAAEAARRGILRRYEPRFGGFGAGPKFPQPPLLEFLLLEGTRLAEADLLSKVRFTLARMERGGLRDQVGGGFHRYSVDGEWRVPHYEKMLCDNALLASLYALAHRVTGDTGLLGVAREVIEDIERSLALPEGGFAAALDADSEGEEGRYYRWTPGQAIQVLGSEEGEFFTRAFGLGEGYDDLAATTPHRPLPWADAAAHEGMEEAAYGARAADCLRRLRAARARRPPPALDAKVLTDWNALAASAYFDLARASGDARYAARGLHVLSFLERTAWNGEILHHLAGEDAPRVPGFLADYAYLARARFAAFEATGSGSHLRSCGILLRAALDRFRDAGSGFLYETPPGSDTLAIPLRDEGDGVLPSPLGTFARSLWSWERLEGGGWAREALSELLRLEAAASLRNPPAHPLLAGLSLWRALPPIDVVVAGAVNAEPASALLRAARFPVHPLLLVLPVSDDPPLGPGWNPGGAFEGKGDLRDPSAFLCAGGTCAPPILDPHVLGEVIEGACCADAPIS